MTHRTKSTLGKTILLGALLASLTVGAAGPAGAVDVPDRIRVALFADLGSKYQLITPVVTLNSASGMKLSAGGVALGAVAAGQTIRFGVDGYRAKVLETADLGAGIAALKKVQASSNAAFLTMLTKNGKPVYQLTEGNYATAAQAAAALAKWTSAGVASGLQSLAPPAVAGPLSVVSGPYGSEADAQAAAARIGAAGLDAFVARKLAEGAGAYFVRIGQASDAAGQASLLQVAAAAGLQARMPDAAEKFVTIRGDMTYNASANQSVPFYLLPQAGSVTLRADPTGDKGITATERSKRTYRGSMEVGVLNNSLTLVNDLPLEQYLYSVVASEIYPGWPQETLKAQAVAARSYALSQGMAFQIAHVVDTTLSQSYGGMANESPLSNAAVDATAGEVLTYNGKIIQAVFSADAGGVTADNLTEIWRSDTPYLASAVTSPDTGPQDGKLDWYRIALPGGQTGYIRSDYLVDSGQKNAAGIELYRSTGDGVAVRSSPQVATDVDPIARMNAGDTAVVLAKVPEYSNYSWVEAPFTADQLLASINKRAKDKIAGSLTTLEVSQRGPSGRATQIAANGTSVDVGVPDNLRSTLGGIKSTLFDIEETGRFSVLGANGQQKDFPASAGASSLRIAGAGGAVKTAGSDNLIVMNGKGELRAATTTPQFVISGKGYGHGLGLSQWGAKGLGDQGYDYKSILLYYYKDVKIEKDG